MSWSAPEDWSRWDPEKLLVCPYDEVHLIKAKRFQHHLLKCRKNHPEKDFVNCPFNAKHVMLRSELRHHVSRCPDRTVIEQYNYKGSEKDEDGFYFKGDTSVPSYHKTEELQEPLERWDIDEEGNLQWSGQSNVNRPQNNQGLAQSPTTVTDTLSLSPEERERFKRQMRREAALRNVNSGMQLPSGRGSASQGYNTSTDLIERQLSPPTNSVFRHCVQQSAVSGPFLHGAHNSAQKNAPTSPASKPRNPIFEHYIAQMQNKTDLSKESSTVSAHEQGQRQCDTNVVQPCRLDGSISSESIPTSSVNTNVELREGLIEREMESRLSLHEPTSKPEVAAVSNICGQPTSPASAGVKNPQLAGVGRARLRAEARQKNFGGICYSPPKVTATEITTIPPVGRGRGMLNYFMYPS